jgi:hypothetical protein
LSVALTRLGVSVLPWRVLDNTRTVYVAAVIALALGLFFLFVWSPLPWGWLGIDHYDDRARRLAAGEPFDTTDVPWGYAYYLAFFYVIFGPHPWIPLLVQVVLNAFVPVVLYQLVKPLAGQRTAVLSALLAGVFSFNTAYAATQSSDAVCTVLLLASLLLFDRARRSGGLVLFAVSGLAAGLAPQFRPNLILFPLMLGALYLVARPRSVAKLGHAAVYLGMAAVVLMPWVWRNYRLTNDFLPASTHGGVQLWYGTLQTGQYLESRAHNPRSTFAITPFGYTSLHALPLIVSAEAQGCARNVELIYWTDRDPTPVRLAPQQTEGLNLRFELPGQPDPTTISYYFEAGVRGDSSRQWTPAEGPHDPFVFVVSQDHLGDLDRHHHLLDVFDVVRLLRFLTWAEPLPNPMALDLSDDGHVEAEDVRVAIRRLAEKVEQHAGHEVVTGIEETQESVALRLADGSTLRIPRSFSGRVTDIEIDGGLAAKLVYSHRGFRELRTIGPHPQFSEWCGAVSQATVNDVFYRQEPHLMRRYTALALDNIRREPLAFALASVYRVFRLFVIKGSDERLTAQQFAASTWIYRAGFVLSLSYFVLFLMGVWIAWRRRYAVLPLLLPVVYVPLTIAFVLTNMRYTVSVQPYVFVFVAIALLAVIDRSNQRLLR